MENSRIESLFTPADPVDPEGMLLFAARSLVLGRHEEHEEWVRKAADSGHAGAANQLAGILHYRGESQEAETWILKAANWGDPDGMFNLALILQENGSTEQALEWYHRVVDRHDGQTREDAMINLGLALKKKGDFGGAESWLLKAAEKGRALAMHNLGCLFEDLKDYEKAESWFLKATKLGFIGSMFLLAVMLREQGKLDEASLWFERAARVGHEEAKQTLVKHYLDIGKSRDAQIWRDNSGPKAFSLASFWRTRPLRKLTDEELHALCAPDETSSWSEETMEASFEIACGSFYDHQDRGPEETKVIEQIVRPLVDRGFAKGAFILGVVYERQGRLLDAESAFLIGAEAGFTDCMWELGVLYREKLGDKTKASHWITLAAENGDEIAARELGVSCLEQGDSAQAEIWATYSARAGNGLGMALLGELYEEQGNLEKAREWLLQPEAGLADPRSYFLLGKIAERSGDNVGAQRWFLKAAENGIAEAVARLRD